MKKIWQLIFILSLINCTNINNLRKIDIVNNLNEISQQKPNKSTIPLVINDKVIYFIEKYTKGGRNNFTETLKRGAPYFQNLREFFKSENLPLELIYLPIIESGFRYNAISPKSASGIWQFMSGTAKLYGLHSDWWVDERRCFDKSTVAAAKHLKELYLRFNDWHLALASYNAGSGKVIKAIKKYKTKNFWEISKHKWNLLKKETLNYVPKFIATVIICENLEKFGFYIETPVNNNFTPYEIVEIPDATDLEVIANCCNVDVEEIKKLNPELKRWATPPKYNNFKIRIPYGTKEIFISNFNKIPPEERITYRRHKVLKGESIWSIASKYDVPRNIIIEMNNLKNPSKIRDGDYLIIPIKGLEKAKKIDEILSKENEDYSKKYSRD